MLGEALRMQVTRLELIVSGRFRLAAAGREMEAGVGCVSPDSAAFLQLFSF